MLDVDGLNGRCLPLNVALFGMSILASIFRVVARTKR